MPEVGQFRAQELRTVSRAGGRDFITGDSSWSPEHIQHPVQALRHRGMTCYLAPLYPWLDMQDHQATGSAGSHEGLSFPAFLFPFLWEKKMYLQIGI